MTPIEPPDHAPENISTPAADPPKNSATQQPSTAGMTTKVVKGSIWTLAGQILPFVASLFTAPFVIRGLGSEGYGVLVLVALLPNYFLFADLGMGVASTKFGAEAYGKGDAAGEGRIVRTAATIAFLASLFVALPMIVFAGPIVRLLNVPEAYLSDAQIALQLSTVTFVLSLLSSVFNTPQLARLRMDLNASINAAGRIVLAIGTMVIVLLGGGIKGAAIFGLAIGITGLAAHIFVSRKLLPELIGFSIDRSIIRPLMIFGGGMLASGVAGMLLIHFEKVVLTKLVSVRSLAYYSVAFTLANIATMFSWGMVQSLIPAFSQLLTEERRVQFDSLFARSIRINVGWLLPGIMVLFVVAKPFLTIWAGEEFGRESVLPFYILLFGLFFNVVAHTPHAVLTASGRTDALAKLYWIELVPYMAAAVGLIYYFGIVGAALAWSLRVIADAFAVGYLAQRLSGLRFNFRERLGSFYLSGSVLVVPILLTIFFPDRLLIIIPAAVIAGLIYLFLIWRFSLEVDEIAWVRAMVTSVLSRTTRN